MPSITTIEQSNNLLELGLDPLTSDMSYSMSSKGLNGDYEWTPSVGLDVSVKNNLFSFRYGYVVPAWSLSALLDVVFTAENHQTCELHKIGDGGWVCDIGTRYIEASGKTPLDAVYGCVIALLENGYLKTNDNG